MNLTWVLKTDFLPLNQRLRHV